MAGPVWNYEESLKGTCDACLREVQGMYVEGEVADNALQPIRCICRECFRRDARLVIGGEVGGRVDGPAYAHNTEARKG